jgi:hypothetical protein
LKLTAKFATQRLATVLKRGLSGTVTCSRACTVDAAVVVESKSMKRYGTTLRAGSRTPLRIELTRALRSKLKRAKSLRATVTLTARSGAETVTRSFRIRLRK